MTENQDPHPIEPQVRSDKPKTLRQRAEALLGMSRKDVSAMSSEDIQSLVHELQVHQIELELQNEELMQTQIELAHSRDRYSDLYDFAPFGCLTLDKEGVILEASLTAAAMLGIVRQHLIGRNLSEFIDRDGQDEWFLHRRAVFADGWKVVCELLLKMADGEQFHARLESVPSPEPTNHPNTCRTALIDVTEKHEAEDKLRRLNDELDQRVNDRTIELLQAIGDSQDETNRRRELETQLRREVDITSGLLDTAQAIILLLDPEGKIVRFNDYMAQLTGYALEEVQGKDWFETFLPSEDRVPTRELFHRSIRGEPTSGNVNPILTRGGQLREIEWHDSHLKDEDGELIGLLCTGIDVTERNRANKLIKDREERLRAVLNTAVDAIITIDKHGTITGANPATQAMFGYAEAEMIGQNVSMLMPSPYRDQHDQYISNYLRTGVAKIIGTGREVAGLRKDGETFPIDLSVSQIDHLEEFTGIIRDISDRKKMEQYLADARIDERRHLAQELHDGVGGQLTGVHMLAKLLHQQLEAEGLPQAEHAEALHRHIREAHEQVRAVSRGILPVEVLSSGFVAAVRKLTLHTSEHGNVRCELQVAGEIHIENKDHANHLFRIAQEAISNALRHARSSEIRVSLEADDRCTILTVWDDGVGIQESPDSAAGMGLRTMRFRANHIGAALTVKPANNGGTAVTCIYHHEAKA